MQRGSTASTSTAWRTTSGARAGLITCPASDRTSDPSVAGNAGRCVLEVGLSGRREPLVVEGVGVQGEPDHAKGCILRHREVLWRGRFAERVELSPAGPDRELHDAIGYGVAVGILGQPALVQVVVPCEHDVDAARVEQLPERDKGRRLRTGVRRLPLVVDKLLP